MSYFVVENFGHGLDRRKHILSLPPGSLYVGRNVNINRGGEIETCKDFVPKYTLPANTFGMIAAAGQLYAFGSVPDPGLPAGIQYQRLQHPSGLAMTAMVWAYPIKGKIYAIAAFQGGFITHFYNGSVVADWQTGAVGGAITSNADLAGRFATIINTDPRFSATSSGTVVTIVGLPNAAFTISANAVNGGATDDQTATVALVQAAAAGVPQISTVTIGGTFEAADTFSIVLAGTAFGGAPSTQGEQGTVIIALKGKAHSVAGPNLFGSAIDDPTEWNAGTGSFVIDMSSQAEGAERLTALGIFQNLLAIFARNTIQLWAMDADPANNAVRQVLQNIGTMAPKTVKAFGDQDVFFLSDTGLRSLKTRLNSDTAAMSDIGSPVDPLIIAAIAAAGGGASKAIGAIDPVDGRYLLHIGTVTYAFSFFPNGKVAGWSTYEFDLPITDFAIVGQRVYARAGDVIYLIGGDNNAVYTQRAPFVKLPFLSARQISTWKHFTGIDVIVDGEWTIKVATDPNDPDVEEEVAHVTQSSVGNEEGPAIPVNGESEMVSLSFTGEGDGTYARLSTVVVHYEPRDAA